MPPVWLVPVLNPPPILAVKAQLLLDFLPLSQTSSQTYGALATLLHARPTHTTLTISLSTLEEVSLVLSQAISACHVNDVTPTPVP